jgi:uncharacterized damage-inducible protein DinB
MARILVDRALAALGASRQAITIMFEGIPPEQFTHQPCEGANHAMWIMGHLASVDDYFLAKLAGRPDSRFDEVKRTFFMRSKPQPSLDSYPPLAEVRAHFDDARRRFLDWVGTFDDEGLAAPLPDPFSNFMPTYVGLFGHLAWHEGMHAGQLSVVRKSLGIAPVFA